MDSSNPAIELASTLQSASINRAPSPTHDLNPSTSASSKIPVELSHSSSHSQPHPYDNEILEAGIELDDDDISESALRPAPRRASFGPLPDLRFEQSYLASIAGAENNWRVGWITVRDQVLLPLLQGTIWSLALHGWRHWNRATQLSGQTVGAKVRRWWYKTNNWKLPDLRRVGRDRKLAGDVGDVSSYSSRSPLRAGLGLGGVGGWKGRWGVPCFTDVV